MSTFLKVVGILALCVVGGCVGLGILGGIAASNNPQVKQAVQQMQAPPIITMAEFNQLATGMSYDQALGIIGDPGELSSTNTIQMPNGPLVTSMYTWTNGDFTSANAMFQNNALMQKSQFGLK